jgi:hypothetical protein
MSNYSKALIEELCSRKSITDAQGNVHLKPTPPPLRVIKKGAWAFPPLPKSRTPRETA